MSSPQKESRSVHDNNVYGSTSPVSSGESFCTLARALEDGTFSNRPGGINRVTEKMEF